MMFKLLFLFFVFIFMFGFIFSNQFVFEELQNAKDTISLMKSQGLLTNRIEDVYFVANSNYLNILSEKKTDFSIVIEKLNELNIISRQAFNVVDEFKLFELELADADKIIDLSEVIIIYDLAKKELKDERYSIALDKLTEARQKIVELKSFSARTRSISTQLGKGLLSFLNILKYWIIGFFMTIILLYIIFRKKLNRYLINRKYRKYEKEKLVLQTLIKRLQTDYFMGNAVSETNYNVKLKKYSDIINDINRELAILNEEMVKQG